MEWDQVVDVLVIGSGASGFSAAIAARAVDADVLILERTDKLGGTSAASGGVTWIPNNHHMAEVGSSDSPERAMEYIRSVSLGSMDLDLAQVFVDEAPSVIRFLEENTPLRYRSGKIPDYHPEFPGGNFGRSLSPMLIAGGELGEARALLRQAPFFALPYGMHDADDKIDFLDAELMGDRIRNDMLANGQALMASLIKGAMDIGVNWRLNFRALRLVVENDAVVGVEGECEGKTVRVGARRGVVLASGGFEWNKELTKSLIRGPMQAPISPPHNEGDGLKMAQALGAAMQNLGEAFWIPAIQIPGEEYDGAQLSRLTMKERTSPGSIIVNKAGERFVNEATNYNDVGRTFYNFDAHSFTYPNIDAWFILHQGFLNRYPFGTWFPGSPIPSWFTKGATLRELAEKLGIDADGLEKTVAEFNRHAVDGLDPHFKRGESAYDRFSGDDSYEGGRQTVGPLDEAPFYAVQAYLGSPGTKGGPKVNGKANVLHTFGEPIAGLYAAGNISSFTGLAYLGAGTTLGPGLTFGHIAGREAASTPDRF